MKKITFKRTSMLKALEHGLADYVPQALSPEDMRKSL